MHRWSCDYVDKRDFVNSKRKSVLFIKIEKELHNVIENNNESGIAVDKFKANMILESILETHHLSHLLKKMVGNIHLVRVGCANFTKGTTYHREFQQQKCKMISLQILK